MRRLRLHGLIERTARSQRYTATDFGLRLALFFTRSYARVIRPALTEVFTNPPSQDQRLQRAFADVETVMNAYVAEAKLAA